MDKNFRLVLVVDDEPDNLELMMRILRNEYRMAFATSGVEALKVTKKLHPDIILLDIMMPEMDGYETCQRLKADETTQNIPVVFVTAKGETEDETRGLGLGAIDYMTKPVSPPIVKARIRNHLALKVAREEIEEKSRKLEDQNNELLEAARLREDVERITRHDLKTPLNAVINFPRFLMRDPELSPKYFEYLKTIEEAGLCMLKMINRSLDLFKMEQKIYELKPDKVDIARTIKRIFNENKKMAERKGLSKMIRINGKTVTNKGAFYVYGEEMLCYSMLANLIKNALEASPKKEAIVIDLFEENEASVISVYNKGIVPEDIRDRFFDKYTTSGKASGSGLGTYSARMIAQVHGGDIHLDTSDEKGTSVRVQLPVNNE